MNEDPSNSSVPSPTETPAIDLDPADFVVPAMITIIEHNKAAEIIFVRPGRFDPA